MGHVWLSNLQIVEWCHLVERGVSAYNDLTFYFNFNPGSETIVSSKNECLLSSTIQGNAIILTYTGNSLSDVITFVLKSNDNTIQKTLKYNLGLTTENALPSGFSGVSITTRNNYYGPVQFSFNKNIVSMTYIFV